MTTTAGPKTPFISTLPGRYYYEQEIFEQEQERIFGRMWICVGRADAVPEPGSYQVVSLAQESVIVVRDKDGVLQAFLNVCRHRGARLCTQAEGKLQGSIQCRYHAWTYGLDGKLIGAPNVLSETQFERALYGLLPVALEVWQGLIWLNLSDNPAPLASQVNEILARRFDSYATFARYGVRDLKVGKTIVYDIQANWKIITENFMECYHCGTVHPELCDLLPGYRSGSVYADGEAAKFAEGAEAFSITGKASRPPLKGLLPEDMRLYYGIEMTPNVLMNLLDDHVLIHTLWPEGPERTRIICDWLFDADEMAKPGFDPMDAVEIFDIVNRQDWEVCEMTQQGMRSRAYKNGGVFAPVEHHIRAFDDFILEKLDQ
jgi:Rieske 2Fe-2S family protein